MPKFTKLNLKFQEEKPVIASLHTSICSTYKDLLKSYMNADYIETTPLDIINTNNSTKFLLPQQIYLGVDVMQFFNRPEYVNNIQLRKDLVSGCVKFLVTGSIEIKKRFDFNDKILPNLSVFKASTAIDPKTRIDTPSLLPLMVLLSRIVEPKDYQFIDDEWRQLPDAKLPMDM